MLLLFERISVPAPILVTEALALSSAEAKVTVWPFVSMLYAQVPDGENLLE